MIQAVSAGGTPDGLFQRFLPGRPANETYDAGLSLDVDRRIADNFVYSPGLGKHRNMA